MAEIRKHNPVVSGRIDQTILAALGEDVRPVVPGSPRERATPTAPAGLGAAAVGGVGTLAWFTVAPTPPPRAEDDEDDEDEFDEDLTEDDELTDDVGDADAERPARPDEE